MTLQDWTERVQSAVRMCNLTPELQAEVALGALEGDIRRAVMVRPESEWDTLEKIFSLLEKAQGGTKVVQLRSHFFNRPQREGAVLQCPTGDVKLNTAARPRGHGSLPGGGKTGYYETSS